MTLSLALFVLRPTNSSRRHDDIRYLFFFWKCIFVWPLIKCKPVTFSPILTCASHQSRATIRVDGRHNNRTAENHATKISTTDKSNINSIQIQVQIKMKRTSNGHDHEQWVQNMKIIACVQMTFGACAISCIQIKFYDLFTSVNRLSATKSKATAIKPDGNCLPAENCESLESLWSHLPKANRQEKKVISFSF